ncbi:MAG: hypothetical protein DMF56_22355 [Acidobacteria bacterium]|nr:MAG: hypothetical protein DMF56_22355 [Acidobacteriota bacterium]
MNEIAKRIGITELTNIFVPFALLLAAALVVPEARQDVLHARIIFTIWVSLGFLIPSVVLFFLPGQGPKKSAYWLLCWTAGFIAYIVHFYYTVGVFFHGSLAEVYSAQRPVIATSNLIDTVWWALDVFLAWFVLDRKWIRVQRVLAHIYIPATFFVSAVLIKHGFVKGLGIVMTIAVGIALIIRFISWRNRAEGHTAVTMAPPGAQA